MALLRLTYIWLGSQNSYSICLTMYLDHTKLCVYVRMCVCAHICMLGGLKQPSSFVLPNEQVG